jgi:hypothetical protein
MWRRERTIKVQSERYKKPELLSHSLHTDYRVILGLTQSVQAYFTSKLSEGAISNQQGELSSLSGSLLATYQYDLGSSI